MAQTFLSASDAGGAPAFLFRLDFPAGTARAAVKQQLMEAPARGNAGVQPAADDALAALRVGLARAAEDTASRLYGDVITWGMLAGAAVMLALLTLPVEARLAGIPLVPVAIVGMGAVATNGYRRWRCRELLDRARHLPPEAVRALLQPVASGARRYEREIARSLLRDLHLPTEVTPSTAPISRGDEPSPAAFPSPSPTPDGECALRILGDQRLAWRDERGLEARVSLAEKAGTDERHHPPEAAHRAVAAVRGAG